MPKVLVVFPVSDVGGGEQVLFNLIRFRERNLDYHGLVISDTDGPLSDRLTGLGVPHTRVRRGRMRNPLSLMSAVRAARQVISNMRPDILLSNSSQGHLYARLASGGGVPSALYFMSVPAGRLAPLDELTWRLPPDRVFAASNAIAAMLRHRGVEHVSTIYHGAPEPVATPDQRMALSRRLDELAIPDGARIVLMPGRLQRWKGQLAFIRAFESVASADPRAHAVILGGAMFGREKAFGFELDLEIRRLGLQSRVHLAGHEPIAAWLERASCVVHASLQPDAFPNVCIEALAARRPLVTNAESGVAEILSTGANAWVVPPRNIGALGAAIQDALSDPVRAARVAEAGYRQYCEHCTPSHMVRPIEAELCTMMG